MHHVPPNRKLPDQIFFVTTVLEPRQPRFANPRAAQIVLDSFQFFRARREGKLYGFVIMPDHLHFIVKPLAPQTLPNLMRRLKSHVAHELDEGIIWEKSYYSEIMTSKSLFYQKLRYTHDNPPRAGLTLDDVSYPWSSASQYASAAPSDSIDSFTGIDNIPDPD